MLIRNGSIIDGTKKERYQADIRIREGVIQEIGKLQKKPGEEIVDASSKFVAPGFVDILNHADVYLTLFQNPAQESLLQQGITTILLGNCGTSLAPLTEARVVNSVQKWSDPGSLNINWLTVGEFLQELEQHKFALNLGTLVGHTTLRRGLIGDEVRELSDKEFKQMQYLLEQGLQEGAFGLSTGLSYSHGKIAPPLEIE